MPALLPSQLDPLEEHEIPPEYDRDAVRRFIAWCQESEGAELANAQRIFAELCEVLRVEKPHLKKAGGDNSYIFEEDVKHGKQHRRIDVYRRGCFVFEAKQGVNPVQASAAAGHVRVRPGHTRTVRGAGVRGSTDWVDSMRSGRHQAGNYAVHVTERGDAKPPFVIVADVGYRLWIWSSFSRDARDDYGDFEQLAAFSWDDLERPEVFKLLRQIWLEPEMLNEEARGQRVTADIAEKVGRLATRLEKRFKPEQVGDFLMKCVFTMFAEDVGFLPVNLFTDRLVGWLEEARRGHPERFERGLRALWIRMRDGGDLDSGHVIKQFNGYLFRDSEPLALQADEMEDLLLAARTNWRKVSPAIFGTLLERALDGKKRQRLGAHYTPEAYIRRLVDKTIMLPLREEWTNARAKMEQELRTGERSAKARENALEIGHAFRKRLASTKVLDPACGSGNFLYVALKEMKRLEGEVVRALDAIGNKQQWLDLPEETVHPAQFYGIEREAWAAKIAELVLWIGYLQWQVSAQRIERMPPPLLQDLQHIENDDALFRFKEMDTLSYKDGKMVLRARGVTDKKAERQMVPVGHYTGVRRAEWPAAEFIVGNPPFLGNKRLNDVLDPGYVAAIREAYPEVPRTADLVMYWWWRCADLLQQGGQAVAAQAQAVGEAGSNAEQTVPRKRKPSPMKAKKARVRQGETAVVPLRRFGLVTTNSITQKFNRAVVADALVHKGLKLAYAIADHPWYDEGAAVRIAMTVGACKAEKPVRGAVMDESKTKVADLDLVKVEDFVVDGIHADLASGADVQAAVRLRANQRLTYQGVNPVGAGFQLSPADLHSLGYSAAHRPAVVRPYISGRDLAQRTEEQYIIDFFGIEAGQAQVTYPVLWERLARLVRPEREKNNREIRRRNWWLFGEPVGKLRLATAGLSRYIGTCRTAKYRLFAFVSGDVLPNTEVVVVAVEKADILAVLSSRVHLTWVDRTKGMLEDRPRYNHTETFEPFPFPSLTPEQSADLAKLGERLDQHRKARQKEHPTLTLTDAYNVLEKLRAGESLDEEEQRVRDMALADTLLHIHDEIDRATLAAYGWPADLSEEEIIARLVALNAERAKEEESGFIRWLRPEYQAASVQTALPTATLPTAEGEIGKPKKEKPRPAAAWPADMPGRIQALTTVLREHRKTEGEKPLSTAGVAALFQSAKLDDVFMTLQCAAAADAVARVELDEGELGWMARAT